MIGSLVSEIKEFCVEETQKIIAELQQERFGHGGKFNDNQAWKRNAQDVIKDKGTDQPLVDTGHLESELSTPSNWNLSPFDKGMKGIKITIPKTESFTESKYDKLQTGGYSDGYISARGKKMRGRELPARNFKDLSQEDADWVVRKLVERLKEKFE